MSATSSSIEPDNIANLQKQASASFIIGKYAESAKLYSQAIALDSASKTNYWYLGLSQLLQGLEDDSQMTWFSAIEDAESDQIEQWTDQLGQVLEKEAQRQESLGLEQSALTIRYHLCDVSPSLTNLISIILISLKLKTFTASELVDLGIIDLLNSKEFISLNEELLSEILEKILTFNAIDEVITQFIQDICLAHIHFKTVIVNKFSEVGTKFADEGKPEIAIKILEIGLCVDAQSLDILMYLSDLYCQLKNHEKSIEIGRQLYKAKVTSDGKTIDKVLACQCLVHALISDCSYWEETVKIHQEFESYLESLVKERPNDLSLQGVYIHSIVTGFFSPYFGDSPQKNHMLRRNLRQLVSARFIATEKVRIENYSKRQSIRRQTYSIDRPLKIGYLSRNLGRHSIGYLSRYLVKYHDRTQFELYGYFVGNRADAIQLWFEQQFYKSHKELSNNPLNLAAQIAQDGIDILVDLDSITSTVSSLVLVLKPAPIQLTWLGWDAVGEAKVDYFIADPYVLPDSAQEYYAEKIWRLPHTFVAVDGFEIATPTIRRSLLNIPNDAVIYFSAQAVMKRHPNCIRMQMRIIKLVPNSYLLVKSITGNQESLQEFFNQIAKLEGVSKDRLRFLPFTSSEEEHRANLSIADVVLDTYPYNGATHTMETLWMGIPMVTRVGEQFAARNSYTMMVNAGISEGIAWTDDEYVDWGMRLGTDLNLRQQVSWKLTQGRQTAPLWDTRQFTLDMENAYKQMWAKYLDAEEQEQDLDPERDRDLFIAEAEMQNTQGINFAHQSKLDSAILSFQAAIALDVNHADAYYNLGIALSETGNIEQALLNFQTTVKLNPNHANGLYNLGLTLFKLGEIDQAIASYSQSLAALPNDVQTHHALGNVFFAQSKWNDAIECYQSALSIDPSFVPALCSMGAALSEQGNLQEALSFLQSAIDFDPNSAEAYCNLGHVLSKTKQFTDAVNCYGKAIQLKPDLGNAYWNFNNDILANAEHPLHHNYMLRRQLADQFVEACDKTEKVRSLVNFITNYTHSGLSDVAKPILKDLEIYIFEHSDLLTCIEIEVLYNNFMFIVSSIRDNSSLNTLLYKFVSRLYIEKIIKPKIDLDYNMEQFHNYQQIKESIKTSQLRIGFLSPHFSRHPVGWCSFDVIRELADLTPHIYLYGTSDFKSDEYTKLFEQVAEKFYWHKDNPLNGNENTFSGKLTQVIADVSNDKLDILIDLDSLTIPLNIHILYRQLAPLCISWLGFDAPFISSENYCLCDWFTHPSTFDPEYLEKLIRLPNSHMAIAGFECVPIDREQQRKLLGILPEQIAYLFAAPGRKFNNDTAGACIQIIKEVPNSVLLQKGNGDLDVIQSIYKMLCNDHGVDFERVRFLPSYKTEEEHRSTYLLADIFLDSYPYNGGTHNLEALWFNLPVVTRCGEQSFARMGYSFLQSVGISEGVSHSWEEYVEWGIRLGTDTYLRNSIKEKLIQSKQPNSLAPLWNPKELAKDIYNLLGTLVSSDKL
jgi:predicted O-linked N-acetylglucosamine transferase (SPINDLY family)